MAQGKIEIQFKPKGDKALILAVKQLDVVTKRLAGTTSRYEKELEKLGLEQKKLNKTSLFGVKNQRLLGNSFATVRSKLLLYSFAVGLATAAFTKLFRKSSIQEKAEKKLEVALGKSSKALTNYASGLQRVTEFGDEAIINAQALIAAFTDDEKQIKLATKATLDLASAKGMELNAAADLVSKTLGSSTNALSRYGIQVVGAVGSTRRLESLTKNISNLFGGQATAAAATFGGKVNQMSNAVGDAAEAIGDTFQPIMSVFLDDIKDAAEGVSDMFKTLSEFSSETIIRKFEELGISTENIIPIKLLAIQERLGFNLDNQEKSISNLISKNRTLLPIISSYGKITEINTKSGMVNDSQLVKMSVGVENYSVILDSAKKGMKALTDELKQTEDIDEQSIRTKQSQILAYSELILMIENWLKVQEDAQRKIEELTSVQTEQVNVVATLWQNWKAGFEGQEAEIAAISDSFGMWSSSVMDIANQYQALQQAELDSEKAARIAATGSIKWEKKRQKEINNINEEFAGKQDALNKKQKKIKYAQTVINTATGIMEAYASEQLGPFAKHAMAIMVGILGAAQLATIDATKYQYGGMVGGRRHSQGGTMIEAEQGEYVISRRGVEAAGIETLNRINAGAGGGSVSITFAGNVLSKDFIEDEAIPQIKEAIRRGADIGVG